jgi:predicted SnoaL-like aldol condensation-catalyzing enzyme
MTTGGDVQDGIRPWSPKQAAVGFAGFPALQKAMADDHTNAPNKRITIRNVLGDGELVAVHSRLDRGPEDQSYATVHIFRFHHGRIVEMWDCGQAMPKDSPNEDGTF